MRMATLAAGLVLGGFASISLAVPALNIDIGRDRDQTVEPGFAGANVPDGMGSDFVGNFNRIDNGNPVGVTLAAIAYTGLVDAGGRTQNAGSDPLDSLIEDFMKVDQDTLTVRLSGLSAGTYGIVSYHNAPDTGVNFSQNFRIEAKDAANAAFTTLVNNKATSTTSDPAAATTAAFNLVSDGTNPVEFRLVSNVLWGNEQPPDRAGHPNNVLINGFTVDAIPEPTSLAALAGAGLLTLARRRLR
jgi:hypothetical protein